MDLSSLNNSTNKIINKVQEYLDNIPEIEFADFQKQQDVKYISDQYNEIVQLYSNLLKLITEVQFFTSQCSKIAKLLSGNSNLERAQQAKVKSAISLVKEVAGPLETERDRLKTIEMFYRALYTRRDF